MSARVEAVLCAVEAVEREPPGTRRVRLYDRARRMILGFVCHPASWQWPIPEGVTHEELMAGNPDVSAEEKAALRILDSRLMSSGMLGRVWVCCSGSKHKAERIKKRCQKRNARRLERRRGAQLARAEAQT